MVKRDGDLEYSRKIGSLIKTLRLAEKMTQRKLAELVHTQQSAISELETGSTPVLSIHLIRRIGKVLGFKLQLNIDLSKREKQ